MVEPAGNKHPKNIKSPLGDGWWDDVNVAVIPTITLVKLYSINRKSMLARIRSALEIKPTARRLRVSQGGRGSSQGSREQKGEMSAETLM